MLETTHESSRRASTETFAKRDILGRVEAISWRTAVVTVTLLAGAFLLGVSLRLDAGSSAFYPVNLGLFGVLAGGALLSGPIPMGRISFKPVLVGLLLAAVFLAGAFIVRQFRPLREDVVGALAQAHHGPAIRVWLLVIAVGAAEELIFRGGLFEALRPPHQVAGSTIISAIVTSATGNAMLVIAAAVLGLVTSQQRRISGGVLSPIITHVTWASVLFYALPKIFGT